MAEILTEHGKIGIEPIRVRKDVDVTFRLWIDRGRGKYGAIEISHGELQQLIKIAGGVLGGSHLKPQRKFERKITALSQSIRKEGND